MPSCARAFGAYPDVYLYPFPACTAQESPCWPCCAKPEGMGMALGVTESLGHGEAGFRVSWAMFAGGEFFSTKEKQIWVNQPR